MSKEFTGWVDPRAISHEGSWGTYKCTNCGKIFKVLMSDKKNAKRVFCCYECSREFKYGPSEFQTCWVDPRAISNKGQWGVYKCERCGKLFNARMCAKKRAKHIFCSRKCKQDSQVKLDRVKIDNEVYKEIYNKYSSTVKMLAHTICKTTYAKTMLEDFMQYGYLELWDTYNRLMKERKEDIRNDGCKSYVKKAVTMRMLHDGAILFRQNNNYINRHADLEDIEVLGDNDTWNILSQKIG